jgi:hypothetical protein
MQRPSHDQPHWAIEILRIISERTLHIDEELCACFTDWKSVFDRANWIKLMQLVKGTGIDWSERRLIRKFYMDQSVKLRLVRGETKGVKIGRGVRQGCCLSLILFNSYGEYLIKETLEKFGDFRIRRQVIARFAVIQFRHITNKLFISTHLFKEATFCIFRTKLH